MRLLVFLLKKFSIKLFPRHQIIHSEWKATGTIGHEQSCKATNKDGAKMYSSRVHLCKLLTHTDTHKKKKKKKGTPHKSGNINNLTIIYNHTNSRANDKQSQSCDKDGPLLHSRIHQRILYLVSFNKEKEMKFVLTNTASHSSF